MTCSSPALRAARSVSSRASSSNDAGTVSSTSCCASASSCRAAGDVDVERRGEMPQVRRRRVDRRHVRDFGRSAPRQDRRRAVRAAVRQPGLRAGDRAAPGSRRRACARARRRRTGGCGSHGSARLPCREVELARDVEKRRQQRRAADLARVDELRDRPAPGSRTFLGPRACPPTRARSWWCRDRCRRRSECSRGVRYETSTSAGATTVLAGEAAAAAPRGSLRQPR